MKYRNAMITRRRKFGLIIPMIIFVMLLVALYSIKAQTLAAKARVNALAQTLVHEKQTVQMLSAEIAHLESPERLRILSSQQLELNPTPVSRTLTMAEASQKIAKKPDMSPTLEAESGQ